MQLIAVLSVCGYYFLVIHKIKLNIFSASFFMIAPGMLFFQGEYFLTPLVFYFLIYYTQHCDINQYYKLFLYFTSFVSACSVALFLMKGAGFYTYLSFENQFFPAFNRLLGMDGSPVGLSLLIAIGILSYFKCKKTLLHGALLIFLIACILWTGSRTIILAAVMASLFAVFRKRAYSVMLFCIVLLPFFILYLYLNFDKNDLVLYSVEKVTSYRIVNWVNALDYYYRQGVETQLFGVGHLPVLQEPYLTQSLWNGYYKYKYVTYTESAILRILVNFGALFFTLFFGYIFYLASAKLSYYNRYVVVFILLCSLLYDPVYSVQYSIIYIFLFYHLRNVEINEHLRS